MHSDLNFALRSQNLSYQYADGPELTFPDLTVSRGEVLLITGASGSGKTTLLHLLSGLLTPHSGSLLFAGQVVDYGQVAELDRLRGKYIGFIYQRPVFIATLTNWNNLRLSPYRTSDEDVLELARQLAIDHLLQQRPGEISTGEQQRLAIARALVHLPGLILADEPTSSLDRENCLNVYELLRDQAEKKRAALLIVTHDERLQELVPNQVKLSPITRSPKSPK